MKAALARQPYRPLSGVANLSLPEAVLSSVVHLVLEGVASFMSLDHFLALLAIKRAATNLTRLDVLWIHGSFSEEVIFFVNELSISCLDLTKLGVAAG